MEKIPDKPGGLESPEKKKTKMVCAWCGKEMGETEGAGGTTHGVCEKCENDALAKTKEYVESK